jgi:hypothetical protein
MPWMLVLDPGLGRGVAGFAVRMLPDAISLGSLHYVMIAVPVWVHFVSTDGVLTNIATGGHSLVEGWEISSGEQVRSSSLRSTGGAAWTGLEMGNRCERHASLGAINSSASPTEGAMCGARPEKNLEPQILRTKNRGVLGDAHCYSQRICQQAG